MACRASDVLLATTRKLPSRSDTLVSRETDTSEIRMAPEARLSSSRALEYGFSSSTARFPESGAGNEGSLMGSTYNSLNRWVRRFLPASGPLLTRKGADPARAALTGGLRREHVDEQLRAVLPSVATRPADACIATTL